MILMIYTSFSSFVKVDYEILNKKYEISTFEYNNSKNIFSHIINQLKLFFWLLLNISSCKAVYVWFGDYHSLLPVVFSKIFKKKSFIVLGGYDVTYLPEYNYGSFNNPLRAFFTKYSIGNATLNLAVSDNIKEDALIYVPSAKVKIIYTGYSPDKFDWNNIKKNMEVLSVCEATTLQRLYIKGVDLILKVAELLPEVKFRLIALDEKLTRSNFNVPENIKFEDRIPQNKLIKYYQNSSVYIQLSIREGLPNSVCEAMLCGCIPIGTNSGGIPIAIGECGYIATNRDAKEISELIKKSLTEDEAKREKARRRIIENFPLELREKRLLQILKQNL